MEGKVSHSKNLKKHILPVTVGLFVFLLLAFVQIKFTVHPLILLERFMKGGGWLEIIILSLYGGVVTYKMQTPANVPEWRRITWTVFAIVFFSQLAIGLLGFDKFLMTGKLHLPIPMMIISGPIYRGQLSVMTILFISTIILTGPAWCSQLCYFGAFDSLAARGKTKTGAIPHKAAIKSSLIILIISFTLLFRWLNVPVLFATILAAGFGVAGILVMIAYSRKQKKMVHCIVWCPVGSLVSILKPVNPFRMYINSSCTFCMQCTAYCKYDALNRKDIIRGKPGYTCTYCGDCLAACHADSIKYRFFKLSPDKARRLYVFLTVSAHVVFMGLARI